ncbi:MAG: pseudaminic acid synthase [Crocinitomicaceae bacterium]|nr:pseudaminic acid synthase [Crocinitomicaceae bacterium]
MKKSKGVFIIAELSANHNGDIETAKKTVIAAKNSGADAIKLQTYTADTITLNTNKEDFRINQGTIWDGKLLYDLYKEAYTPWEWHKEIFDLAKELDLLCFSSPFDHSAVDFLETLNCPIYKIASFEITDIPLISYVASKGKPIIISTGIAEHEDISLAVEACKKQGNTDITLLKCTSSYPAPIEEANISLMQQIAKDFKVKVGLSDHTMGSTLPIIATALGASVIEKHFILDRSIGGPDASFSMNEREFSEMVQQIRAAEKSIGSTNYKLSEKQEEAKAFSRSLYISKEIKKGEIASKENIKSVRPGYSLHPKHLPQILGKKAKKNFSIGDRISLSDFE